MKLLKCPLFVFAFIFLWLGRLAAADWPQWRGPDRTGRVPANAPVPNSLSPEPKVAWRLEIGGGFSSPVVAGRKLVYLDAREQKETAHLVDAKTGKELWCVSFADLFQDEWGPGPRSTPIIDGSRVYVQSCNGEFRCLNLADGKVVWGASFEKDFGVKFLGSKASEGTASRRGNNGSGVIDGDRIFLPVGNTQGASVVCFDKHNGKVLWKSQNDEAAYSSLMVATLAGVNQVVYLSADALMGIDVSNGKLLWRIPVNTGAKRHACTPVIFGDTVTVNSQTIGLLCFKIEKDGTGQKLSELWANKNLTINISTPVLVDHYFYSQGRDKSRDFVCVDALTGKEMWRQDGFGDKYSATIPLGKNLLVQTDKGELVLVAADPTKYSEISRVQVCGKTWSHPAYADGKLYVREGLDRAWKLTCFDLMAETKP
jgi:outer membrane protein assembly factor BamB